MPESWYVPVTPEFNSDLDSHVFRAGVPDDVYAIPNAWDQEELGFGRWILRFRDGILSEDQRDRMRDMGCKPVSEGRMSEATKIDKRSVRLARQRVDRAGP